LPDDLLKRAFSAPRTCIRLAGALASLSSPPISVMSLAPTVGPAIAVTFGASTAISCLM
jgi:hypothetical protein